MAAQIAVHGEGTMPIELKYLVWSCALTLVCMVVAAAGAQLQVGLPPLAGNREDLPQLTGWAGRASRAHRNMLENIVLFAALVLVANATGKLNATTALGAQLFFWGRVAYAPIYWIGLPWVRTGAWVVSVVGMLMILGQLL
jgi:uncharacterized MAPEG superfamily protein